MNCDVKRHICDMKCYLTPHAMTQGGVILTEDSIILFGTTGNKEASGSDFVTGTTICTSLCCCLPCCKGTPITRAYAPSDYAPPQHPRMDTGILLRLAIEAR